jgi:radical SAM protein with 4Fe4S-binding SPASM domain
MEKADLEIHLFMVLQKGNMDELPEFIKLGNNLGVDSINGTFVGGLGVNADEKTSIKNRNQGKLNKILVETEKIIKNSKIPVRMKGLLDYMKNPNKEEHNIKAPCYMPWYSPFITWDGYVSPCCICTDKQIVFGNVFERPFKEIWNSKKAREFRKRLKKRRTGICSTCGVEEYYIYNKIKLLKK